MFWVTVSLEAVCVPEPAVGAKSAGWVYYMLH